MNTSRHSRMVAGYFSGIAGWYDFLNHFLSFGLDIWWRKRLVRHVRSGEDGVILDLAAGTLDVARELIRHKPGSRIIALDYTLPMLLKGRRKISSSKAGAIAVQGDGRALPLPESCVETATIAFGIRNIIPRLAAYSEILRVLKPGGRLCILEFGSGKKKILCGAYNFYLNRLLPVIGRIISRDKGAYTYLSETIRDFPDAHELAVEMKQAGFARVFHYSMSSGIVSIHVGEKAAG